MSNTEPNFFADEFLLDHYVGKTPLVRLQRLAKNSRTTVLAKLEGNNPAGSVKDRPAYNMIMQAEKRGQIKPGDTLIEATSGNTGIALAMVAAMRGYKMKLIMPNNMSQERKDAMLAYGAELIEVTQQQGMEGARDLALQMQTEGQGLVLNQFGNPDNVEAHYLTTGPEIWEQTGGKITHFVSSMGTTGTIMGVSKYLKEQNPEIQIVGLQPSEGSSIAGIRRWPKEYLPTIFDASRVDRIIDIPQIEAEKTMRRLAREEGIRAVEFDIRQLSNDQLMIIHDDNFLRTTGVSGSVYDQDIDLQQFDHRHNWKNWPQAEYTPSLTQVLNLLHDFDHIEVEVKAVNNQADAEQLTQSLTQYLQGFEQQVTITSFDEKILHSLQQQNSNFKRGFLIEEDIKAQAIEIAQKLGCCHIGWMDQLATHDMLQLSQQAELNISVWTVNDIDRAKQLRDEGVQGLITDYPKQMLAAL